MVRRWGRLVGVTPLLLGMMVAVPQMVVVPVVLAQSSQSSQATEALRLYREGERLRQQGTRESLQQAIEKYQQALPLLRATRNRRGEAATLSNIGFVYSSIGQPQRALEFLQQALPITREINDRREEAVTLNSIGGAYNNIGQPQRALEFYQQALPILRELKDRSGEAHLLNNIGGVYNSIGQPQRALEFLQQALPIAREVNDRSGEARTLNGISLVYGLIGQPQRALEFYQQALRITREVKDRAGEAAILNNIGLLYHSISQPQQALNFYQQVLPIHRELGNRSGEATTLINIGRVYSDIGQPQQALSFYQQALPIVRGVSDRAGESAALTWIGGVYSDIGQPQQALNHFQQALTIRRELGDRRGVATALNNIGGVYSDIGQPQEALNFYQQSLLIERELGNRSNQATTLNNIGVVYSKIEQPQEALNFFQQALLILREGNDRFGEAATLSRIGKVYRNIGQPQQALNHFQQALTIRREVRNRFGEASTLNNLALVYQALKDFPTALQNIQAAIAIFEDIRGQLIDPDSRTSYFVTVQSAYKLQIDLLMELHQKNPGQGYAAQAFNVTERSKARTLLELLTESRADIRTGVDPQLLQQEQDIQTQLTALDKRRIDLANSRTDNKEQITALEAQRATLQTQYRDLQTQLRATSPKYAALKYPQPLTLEQIQQQILDDNTLILSYSLGEDRSYLWLISKTEMTSYQLPAQKIIEKEVQNAVSQFNLDPKDRNLTDTENRDTIIKKSTPLSNILLKPVLENTGTEQSRSIGNKRLVIISDGALQTLPFGALPDPRVNDNYQPLLVNNEVNYLPSASTLQTIRNETQNRTPAPPSLAVFADPVFSTEDPRVRRQNNPSPNTEVSTAAQNLDRAARDARGAWQRIAGTREEAKAILNLFPADRRLAYYDFQANRTNALSDRLAPYRFVHWATHGFVNTQKPELSGIVMSLVNENGQQQNGYLLLGDIFNLNFNAELVVLSACETGLGEVVQGEGLVGLTRGLMYAGTPRVVTSLWQVPDTETAILMQNFYTKMLQQNLKPSEALRQAQLELFRSKSWVSPYYWAAFTLQGEWR